MATFTPNTAVLSTGVMINYRLITTASLDTANLVINSQTIACTDATEATETFDAIQAFLK